MGITQKMREDPYAFHAIYLGQKLHEKQKEVIKHPFKHKIISCGRRAGKTQMIAGELIRGAILELYKKQIVITPTYKQSKIVFDKIKEIYQNTPEFYQIDILNESLSPHPKIIFVNKYIIDFASADNFTSLRGEAYDRIFIDEAAFIKEDAWNAIKPLAFDTGAPIWMTSTPWGEGEFKEKFQWGVKGVKDYASFHYDYRDNPYLTQEGKEQIETEIKEHGIDSVYVQTEVYGNFVDDVNSYFSMKIINPCIQEIEFQSVHPKAHYFLGADFASGGEDSTVLIIVERSWTTNQHKVVEILELNNKDTMQTVGTIRFLDDKFKFTSIYCDYTGLGIGITDRLKEVMACNVVPYNFTIDSKMKLYANLRTAFDGKMIYIPNHKKLIYQLLDLKYEMTSNKKMKIHHSLGGKDDFCDALSLSCLCIENREIAYSPSIA